MRVPQSLGILLIGIIVGRPLIIIIIIIIMKSERRDNIIV